MTATSASVPLPTEECQIPEIIEEKRKDADGKIVTTKYIKGKLLGKGGFAKCFVGQMMPSKHQYALKIVAKSTLAKSRARAKFQAEIKIHRTLRHTNVVRFERYFEDVDNAYILMELCHNNAMSDMLKKRKKLTEPETRYYLHQLVQSLQYLHSILVIHRDLKLGNLFLDSDMRVKVGDFGLATRLERPDERRKTICGTPNYIAPEILEGKEGHSFEVDVWSTGVIMYTLLIGKPPFESKDVKSTYKRILSNSYSFPDHTVVCEHAKNLIRHMLQPRPESRPSLQVILDHPFFTRPSAYMPPALPKSALYEVPILPQSTVAVGEPKMGYSSRRIGDENDPHAANRAASTGRPDMVAATLLKQQANSPPGVVPTQERRPFAEVGHRPISAPHGTKSAVVASTSTRTLAPPSNSMRPTGALSSAASSGIPGPPPGVKPSTRPQAAHADIGILDPKFDIYTDNTMRPLSSASEEKSVVTISSQSSTASQAGGVLRPHLTTSSSYVTTASTAMLAGGFVDKRSASTKRDLHSARIAGSGSAQYQQPPAKSAAVSTSEQESRHSVPMDLVSDLEQVYLGDDRAHRMRDGATTADGSAPTRPVVEAWTDVHGVSGLAKGSSAGTISARGLVSKPAVAQHTPHNQGVGAGGAAGGGMSSYEDEAMRLATPPDQMVQKNGKVLDTLEQMHQVLSSTCGLDDNSLIENMPASRAPATNTALSQVQVNLRRQLLLQAANIWVVRYVDYTSKYGLGFLLNTGSAGVYFNDSTKIVLSADGKVFQYIERKRKDLPLTSTSSSEHSIQTHLLSCYPTELQKKVTLLCHFRNYLVDQHKTAAPLDGEDMGAGMEASHKIPAAAVDSNASGASSSVRFGVSSVRCGSLGSGGGGGEEDEMPFLKKWVRTKHAILFRLSNRTVQVVFFDRSEVLLSSEARVVTYVNKQGERSDHSLEEVLQTGRKDIAKRLKYTKEIMYKLINIQAR